MDHGSLDWHARAERIGRAEGLLTVFAGLIAREMGGKRRAMIVAAVAPCVFIDYDQAAAGPEGRSAASIAAYLLCPLLTISVVARHHFGAGEITGTNAFHQLRGLLNHLRWAASHGVQCRGDDLFCGNAVDEDQ